MPALSMKKKLFEGASASEKRGPLKVAEKTSLLPRSSNFMRGTCGTMTVNRTPLKNGTTRGKNFLLPGIFSFRAKFFHSARRSRDKPNYVPTHLSLPDNFAASPRPIRTGEKKASRAEFMGARNSKRICKKTRSGPRFSTAGRIHPKPQPRFSRLPAGPRGLRLGIFGKKKKKPPACGAPETHLPGLFLAKFGRARAAAAHRRRGILGRSKNQFSGSSHLMKNQLNSGFSRPRRREDASGGK